MEEVDEAERLALIVLVDRIRTDNFATEEAHTAALDEFVSRVPDPNASGLIYYPDCGPDEEWSSEEIVDRALAYRATPLSGGSDS